MNGTEIQQMDLFDEPIPPETWDKTATQRALDELFYLAGKFRSSKAYGELINFIVRFRFYSPYNAMLVHIQMPGARFVSSPKRWDKKYGRRIKENAHPLVILQPKGPVMYVFDVVDTEPGPNPKPLPSEVENPFKVRRGSVDSRLLDQLIENAKRDGVLILKHKEGSQRGGSIQPANDKAPRYMQIKTGDRVVNVPVRYTILINEMLDRESAFAVIVHELAHLYCGHLGTPNANWWPNRQDLPINVGEFEAESVSYLVCGRLDLHTRSDEYLSGYLKQNEEVPNISLECVMKSAGLIEQMGREHLRPRKDNINE
jgi:hypothetical protein